MGLKGRKRSENVKKLVLTGGHAGSTGYAVIQELQRRYGDMLELYWIGAKHATEGKSSETFEYKMFPKLGVKFYPIYTGRIQRKFTRRTIPSLLKIPIGFVHAFILILSIKPDLVVSFGGYAAYPVVVVSWILGGKSISHEQTNSVGLVTEKTARFVEKIALARRSSMKYLPEEKCVVVGNPISDDWLPRKQKKVIGKPPLILVTGGSRGSVPINNTMLDVIDNMLARYKVIHQTGSDDYARVSENYSRLNSKLRRNIKVIDLMSPGELSKAMQKADLVISRAGANTVSEVIYTKTPAILIPIPVTYRDEQKKNAEYAKEYGLAEVINQDDLTPKLLVRTVERTIKNWDKIIKRVENKTSPDTNASKKFVDIIESYIK